MINILKDRTSYPISMLSPQSPSDDQWSDIWQCVASAPDYGSLLPYRFIVIKNPTLEQLNNTLCNQRIKQYPDSEQRIKDYFTTLNTNIDCLVVSYTIVQNNTVYPVLDQSYGAISAVTQFYTALNALGFGTYWISCRETEQPALKVLLNISLENTVITGIFPIGVPTKLRHKNRPSADKFVEYR